MSSDLSFDPLAQPRRYHYQAGSLMKLNKRAKVFNSNSQDYESYAHMMIRIQKSDEYDDQESDDVVQMFEETR